MRQGGGVAVDENATEDTLLRSQRQERILALLRTQGQVHASALAETFGVSGYTIRRDLDELAEAGHLERVHGGAVPRSPVQRTFGARQQQFVTEKAQSARAALTLLEPEHVVILDGGSTAALFAQALPDHYPATFLTHVPSIAATLIEKQPAEVVAIGGRVDPFSRSAVGASAVEAYRGVTADLCVLGIAGLSAAAGISSPYYEEALVRTAMIAAADKVVGLAVGAKLGTVGAFHVAAADSLTHLAVERDVDDALLQPFRDLGIAVVQAAGDLGADAVEPGPPARQRRPRQDAGAGRR
jgi:DeoR/GlpR family transcriptional regulator of sugar metabolism